MTLSTAKAPAAPKPPTIPTRGDEVTPIIEYIIGEMLTNAISPAATRIREYNLFSSTECIRERYDPLSEWQKFFAGPTISSTCTQQAMHSRLNAVIDWAMHVHEGGDWDHKPHIRTSFTPAVTSGEQHWHHYNGRLYFYDIWSNIHYGYVGRACGFTRSGLLDGAGVEQVGSDLVHFRWPSGNSSIDGMRRFDDASDQASVAIGCDLWPGIPTPEQLRELVVAAPVSQKKL